MEVVDKSAPLGLRWRSSYWFVTFVVGLGIATDLLVYSIIVPVIPFQLEKLGYDQISVHTSWLLFAYSAGLSISTFPAAILSERYDARKLPLILGIFILIGSQIMLMEAPVYWLMCFARVLQGIGSTMVWVVGLALLCDLTPEKYIGRQMGLATIGLSAGTLIGPPVGGALYTRFGFRGPFIFGIVAAILDLVGRLVVIERKEALVWGYDPLAPPEKPRVIEEGNQPAEAGESNTAPSHKEAPIPATKTNDKEPSKPETAIATDLAPKSSPTLWSVVVRLSKSTRAFTVCIITFVYGIVYTCLEPTLPLRLQDIWGFNSAKVGLVFLAGVIPTFFSSPITGYITDRYGTAWVLVLSLLLALPWWVVLILRRGIVLFIAAFALANFFISGTLSPIMAEFAAVSRSDEGVGYAHVYGAFNLAYGIGSAAGPILGGQIYDHVHHGWTALCLLATGLIVLALILCCLFTGDEPIVRSLTRIRGLLPSHISRRSER